jgi:4-aminobutyrate aminotransferase/(S)-3-amino-2-methylpropionate transaminase
MSSKITKILYFKGNYLFDGLNALSKEYPNLINSVRHLGTFGSIDGESPKVRDQLIAKLRSLGVQTGGCGDKSIRLRPALVFEQKHAAIVLDRFRTVLKNF